MRPARVGEKLQRLHHALGRKHPNTTVEGSWPWVHPRQQGLHNAEPGWQGRHHLDPTVVHTAGRRAVLTSEIITAATGHTFQHSFSTHRLERGQGIRAIQKLMGLNDIATAMIQKCFLNRGPLGVQSHDDLLQ